VFVIPAKEFVNLSVETHSSGLLCAWICDWAGPKIDFFTNSKAEIQINPHYQAMRSCRSAHWIPPCEFVNISRKG
jgi:hypothetical protein